MNRRTVLALTYSQSSSVYKSRPIFHPFSSSVLLFAADAQRLSLSHPLSLPLNRSLSPSFFFSLVHSPTYPPLRAITLVARQKGRGRGVEGNGGTGWKVCKSMYINDVRNTAIDIELILKLAVCVCVVNWWLFTVQWRKKGISFLDHPVHLFILKYYIQIHLHNIRSNFDE